ncbi:nitrate reductase cytochrome c-type subunit [Aestuariirhabdus litorea]|uniref:Periplasmic nitrate reductase, electron transfer subunit n=1 Tax=Aestuariirhabdus litorea TaxID=2528527 RepID=A0A3P3VNE7_9GAMM|nr:nitrate reductase cytochrome c-type subunit [Aestuariirhabdus litorea]RRJ83867.1 nitrate reductase cytochrome c-type subunit [Aestuariirhabdus litorea]RWW97090.1 nitrate reductase cytochrome c-type subunit [Endozoicomonadaceae bacterium GTF-13]
MKKIIPVILTSLMTLFLFAPTSSADTGGLNSLRSTQLESDAPADEFKRIPKDRETYERDYLHQPPLIPHQVRGYEVNLNSNKCLSCHSWSNYKQAGATKISMTHFETRDGQQLSDVSPRRYFCSQCHVPQADAKPLVGNEFKSVEALNK